MTARTPHHAWATGLLALLALCNCLALARSKAQDDSAAPPQDALAYLAQHVGPHVLGPHGKAGKASTARHQHDDDDYSSHTTLVLEETAACGSPQAFSAAATCARKDSYHDDAYVGSPRDGFSLNGQRPPKTAANCDVLLYLAQIPGSRNVIKLIGSSITCDVSRTCGQAEFCEGATLATATARTYAFRAASWAPPPARNSLAPCTLGGASRTSDNNGLFAGASDLLQGLGADIRRNNVQAPAPGEGTLCVGVGVVITAPFVGTSDGNTNERRSLDGFLRYETIINIGASGCDATLAEVKQLGLPIVAPGRYTFTFDNEPAPGRE